MFYRKYLVILTYAYDCVIVSHKQETITSLIKSLKNDPENYVFTDEVDISNCIDVNVKKNSDGTFKLFLSHLVDKIINDAILTVSMILNSIENPTGKPL